MNIYPAIDLLGGRCVRLARGEFSRVSVYSDAPAQQAVQLQAGGATHLHVVDLDGARSGRVVHIDAIRSIRGVFEGFVQVGGGIRSQADIATWLAAGVDRVILGTTAVGRPDVMKRALERFGPACLAAAIDLRGETVMTDGWLEGADEPLGAVLARLDEMGLETVVFTDTTRDGMLGSADHERAATFVAAGFRTLVAGGVTSPGDVRRLDAVGANGAIIGSALYEGRLSLAEAIAAC